MHKPLGPRPAGARSASPSPATLKASGTGTTLPLNIVKTPKPVLSLNPISPSPNRTPTPQLKLQIGVSRPNTPKPSIQVQIPLQNGHPNGSNGGGDSPTYPSYYQYGGNGTAQPNSGHPEEMTIRPDSSTCMPAHRPHEPLKDIKEILREIDNRSSSTSSSTSSDSESAPAPSGPAPSTLPWSDDVLEELSRLGEGAGGAVHKVRDKRTGEIMARKTITTREAPMKQLLRELAIISSNTHVNIIQFHGAYMSPSSSELKILMENCEGGSLEAIGKRIKERGAIVGEKIAGRFAEGILQGLAYLHRKKTIHRDIKPSNILLSREGVVKLCDFGVSGELVDSVAGTFTGTSFYMAPERISGNEYTIRSDVWSAGISLLELVQNRFPFPNDLPPIELMMYITSAEPPRLEDEPGEPGVKWPEDMKDFIKQTLTVSATTRPTPKDMLDHPWIVSNVKQEVNMAKWMRQVWGWTRPPTSNSRKSKDQSSKSSGNRDSRPSSSSSPGDGLESPPKSDGSS